MKTNQATDLINKSLWRLAEQETLFLMRSYKLTPQDVIRQYTGKTQHSAELHDAVNVIYCFNLTEAYKNGFVVH